MCTYIRMPSFAFVTAAVLVVSCKCRAELSYYVSTQYNNYICLRARGDRAMLLQLARARATVMARVYRVVRCGPGWSVSCICILCIIVCYCVTCYIVCYGNNKYPSSLSLCSLYYSPTSLLVLLHYAHLSRIRPLVCFCLLLCDAL